MPHLIIASIFVPYPCLAILIELALVFLKMFIDQGAQRSILYQGCIQRGEGVHWDPPPPNNPQN